MNHFSNNGLRRLSGPPGHCQRLISTGHMAPVFRSPDARGNGTCGGRGGAGRSHPNPPVTGEEEEEAAPCVSPPPPFLSPASRGPGRPGMGPNMAPGAAFARAKKPVVVSTNKPGLALLQAAAGLALARGPTEFILAQNNRGASGGASAPSCPAKPAAVAYLAKQDNPHLPPRRRTSLPAPAATSML